MRTRENRPVLPKKSIIKENEDRDDHVVLKFGKGWLKCS